MMEDFHTESNLVAINGTENASEPFDIELIMGPKREPLETAVAMTMMYALILMAGIIGNVCTCTVIARNRYMHTATNYYLFSLAVSDLLLLILGIPQDTYMLWSRYPDVFGEPFCIIRGWTSETSTNASILTITAFTMERYLAICHPIRAHTMSRLSRAIKFIVIIWVCAALAAISQAYQLGIQFEYVNEVPILETAHCGMKRPLAHAFEASTFVFFIFPSTVLTVMYILIGLQLRKSTDIGRKHNGQSTEDSNGIKGSGKTLNALSRQSTRKDSTSSSRKAVVKMLVAVVVAFFICWAPFHAQRLMAVYIVDPTPADYRVFSILTNISGVTYYISATINPILYSIMSLKFRHAFKDTLGRCFGRNSVRKDRHRLTSVYNSTLRSAQYETTDFTVVTECQQGDQQPGPENNQSANRRPSRCPPPPKPQPEVVTRAPPPKETKKVSIRRSISNSSLQMVDEGAFDGVDIMDYIDDVEGR